MGVTVETPRARLLRSLRETAPILRDGLPFGTGAG